VTATQRVLDEPLSMRFHYGHPDVFDKTTAITMGGISRPRCVSLSLLLRLHILLNAALLQVPLMLMLLTLLNVEHRIQLNSVDGGKL
jgi:hypothetical protein